METSIASDPNEAMEDYYNKEQRRTAIALLETEIIKKEGKKLIVPKKLISPHRMIQIAKISIDKHIHPNRGGLVSTSWDDLPIAVTKKNIGLALRFMDTFIKNVEERGHEVSIGHRKTSLLISGESVPFNFREKLKRSSEPNHQNWPQFGYIPTGILTFNAEIRHRNLEWKIGKLPLHKQLALILATLEIEGKALRKRAIEIHQYWEKEAKKKKAMEEEAKLKQEEEANFQALLQQAKKYRETEILREYINEVESKAKEQGSLSVEMISWLEWARDRMCKHNPIGSPFQPIPKQFHPPLFDLSFRNLVL